MADKTEGPVLKIEQLIQPISGEEPVGTYLRYEGIYDQIEEFRKEDDPNLPRGVWQTELKIADWNGVFELATETLRSRSKDLQIAAWLMESMIFLYGIKGVDEGIRLIYELSTRFWDEIYPVLEEDDIEFRASPYLWINSVVSEKLKQVPITQPESDDCEPFSYHDWEKMVHLESLAKQSATARKSLDGELKFTRGEFARSVENTPLTFLLSHRDAIQSTQTITSELCRFLDEKCGKDSPSLEQFKKSLEAIESQINLLIGKRDSIQEADGDGIESEALISNRSTSRSIGFDTGYRIRNREDAYHRLSDIAEYLLESDPHSPVPYLVNRAVSWSSMSLSELLTELLKDGQNLQQIYSLLGIQE